MAASTSDLLTDGPPAPEYGTPAATTPLAHQLYRWRLALQRRWWIIAVGTVLGLIGGLVTAFLAPSIYVSQARLMIAARINLPENSAFGDEQNRYLATQAEILRSPELRNRVLKTLRASPRPPGEEIALQVVPTRLTSLILLETTGSEPDDLLRFLQILIAEYQALSRDKRLETTNQATTQITSEMMRLQKSQEAQEEELFSFRNKYSIAFWEDQGITGARTLSELKNRESNLRNQLKLLESINTGQLLAKSAPTQNAAAYSVDSLPVNEALRRQYVETRQQRFRLAADLAEMLLKLKPLHPKVRKLEEEIARLDRFTGLLQEQNAESLKGSATAIETELGTLRDSIAELEGKVAQSTQISAEFMRLQAKLVSTKDYGARLQSMIQRLQISGNVATESVQVLQQPTVPEPSYRQLRLQFSLCLFGGLAFGIGVVSLLTALDRSLISADELHAALGLTIIGQIPAARIRKNGSDRIITSHDVRMAYVESFRALRSGLRLGLRETAQRVLLVTSSVPREGKSTIVSNLACSLAQGGSRVLLVDADLRRGDLAGIFGQPSAQGLANILAGEISWPTAVRPVPAHPRLDLLARGPTPATPGELLLGPSFRAFITEVRTAYDYVIVDSAPLLAVDDTSGIAGEVDGIVLIVRAGYTAMDDAVRTAEILRQRRGQLLGAVLNFVAPGAPYYGYYRYQEYYH